MELYIHIPFCARKCAYCDFLSFADRDGLREDYLAALIRDIASHGEIASNGETDMHGRTVDIAREPLLTSIYIGGGTPSRMPEGRYAKLFAAIREHFTIAGDAEISMECNPGTVSKEKLAEYREAGINRLSFGVQSADDAELRKLSRIHTWEEAKKSFALAREAGFDNINLDLMVNLPGQTTESFLGTLTKAVSLSPEHISAYSLILEEGTPMYARYAERPDLLPDEDTASETYLATVRFLAEQGYAQYEISNFAKPGRECRHNIGYWKREEYLGIGLGAAGLIGKKRYRVTADMETYLKALTYESVESLSENEIRNETVMLALRMNEGVDLAEYAAKYGNEDAEFVRGSLMKLEKEGLVTSEGSKIALTPRGMLVSNPILAELMI
ncbi:MAG: radical SAM family heme chaperone HemW [Lachnospiraceae bacterium]|nr:radical SAM family heme chaperone HemW [Lachnospiraceae bacterium]